MTQVWKPPHVAQTNTESHLGQHILDFRVPRWPVLIGRLNSIGTVLCRELTFRLALPKPGSIVVVVQWGFLSLGVNKDKE